MKKCLACDHLKSSAFTALVCTFSAGVTMLMIVLVIAF